MFNRIRTASHDLRMHPDLSDTPAEIRHALVWALTFLIRDQTAGSADGFGTPLRSMTLHDVVDLLADQEHGGWIVSKHALVQWLTGPTGKADLAAVQSPLQYREVTGTPSLSIAREDEEHGDPR